MYAIGDTVENFSADACFPYEGPFYLYWGYPYWCIACALNDIWGPQYFTINQCINAASPGDTILVPPGVHSYVEDELTGAVIEVVNHGPTQGHWGDLTIECHDADGTGLPCILDGGGGSEALFPRRGIFIGQNTYRSINVTIDGFDIINGESGIYGQGAGLLLIENQAYEGDGINLTIKNCTFRFGHTFNPNIGEAGGIMADGGPHTTLTLENVIVENNTIGYATNQYPGSMFGGGWEWENDGPTVYMSNTMMCNNYKYQSLTAMDLYIKDGATVVDLGGNCIGVCEGCE